MQATKVQISLQIPVVVVCWPALDNLMPLVSLNGILSIHFVFVTVWILSTHKDKFSLAIAHTQVPGVQVYFIITLSLGSIEKDCVISETEL